MNVRTQSSQKTSGNFFAKQTHSMRPHHVTDLSRSIITKAIRTQMGKSLFTTNAAIYDNSINQI